MGCGCWGCWGERHRSGALEVRVAPIMAVPTGGHVSPEQSFMDAVANSLVWWR